MATESRGKFARLCIQVDVDKPLITTVMIGKLQQTVTYEGIHNLCFECGRMGYKREACPYVIRPVLPCKAAEKEDAGDTGASTHSVHDVDSAGKILGPHGKDDAVQEDVHEGSYGPWVVVARRKKETKFQRDSGSLPGHGHALEQRSNGILLTNRRNWIDVEKPEDANGLNREAKRKLAPLRILEKAHLEQAILRIGKEAQVESAHNANKKVNIPKNGKAYKAGLVKAMKMEARSRVGSMRLVGAVGEETSRDSSPTQRTSQASGVAVAAANLKQIDMAHFSTPSPGGDFQFAAVDETEMGLVRRGGAGDKLGVRSDCEARRADLRQIGMAQLNAPSSDGELQLVAVDEFEMGLVRRGGSGKNQGDRSGCEARSMNWDHGFGQSEVQGLDRELTGGNDGMLGCPGVCTDLGEGIQVAQSDHDSLKDESGGCIALGADLMVLEGRCDDGSYH